MQVRILGDDGAVLAAESVAARTFSTGSKGYQATFKTAIGDKRYQAQIRLVEIGSKPAAAPAATTARRK